MSSDNDKSKATEPSKPNKGTTTSEPKPEPEPEPKPDPKPDPVILICDKCGHKVEQDTEEITEGIMKIHMLSHENEKNIEDSKNKSNHGNYLIFAIGIIALVVSASIVFGGLWMHKKKEFDKDDGK